MEIEIIDYLTLVLVLTTIYYAWEVKKQTKLVASQTRIIFDNWRKDRLDKEIEFVIGPLLRLEYLIEGNSLYWNWHNVAVSEGYNTQDLGIFTGEVFELIRNIMLYKYLSPVNPAIDKYLKNLKELEYLRGEFSILDKKQMENFLEDKRVKEALNELKIAQDSLFSIARIRYMDLLKEKAISFSF
jgi:hypothetical protein